MDNRSLKDTFLNLLEQDKEFRYTVAGLIGLEDIRVSVKRLEEAVAKLVEGQKRNEDRLVQLEERVIKLEERIAENQVRNEERFLKIEERIARVEEEIRNLREDMNNLRRDMQEGFKRHDQEFARVWQSIENMRKDMQEGFKQVDRRLRYIEAYIERTSLTLEDEAREVIEYRLKEKGLALSISNLILPEIELDIYGMDTDTCIIGEVKTRASIKTIEEVDKDIQLLCARYPNLLRERIIKVIYTMQVLPEAVKEADERGIWLMTAKGELTALKV